MRPFWGGLLTVSLFVLLFTWPRLATLSQVALNEENVFLLVAQFAHRGEPISTYTPIGMCDSRVIRESPQHPATHFAIFHFYGKILKLLGVALESGAFTIGLRVAQLLLIVSALMASWLMLGSGSVPSRFSMVAGPIGLAAVLSSPFLVGASVQLQWDGVIGAAPYVLLVGALSKAGQGRKQLILLFLCAALVGFDKPERLAVWLACRLIAAVIVRLVKRQPFMPGKREFVEFCGYAAGCALIFGSNPKNWFDSLNLAFGMSGFRQPTPFLEYWKFFRIFIGLTFALPVALGLLKFARGFFRRPSTRGVEATREEAYLTAFGFCLAIFLASFMARWIGDSFPRYLAPGVFCALIVSWRLLSDTKNGFVKIGLVPLVVYIGVVHAQQLAALQNRSLTSVFTRDLTHLPACPDKSAESACLVAIPYECTREGYLNNFVLDASTASIGSQCSSSVCGGK